jgi:hypothetical protein
MLIVKRVSSNLQATLSAAATALLLVWGYFALACVVAKKHYPFCAHQILVSRPANAGDEKRKVTALIDS